MSWHLAQIAQDCRGRLIDAGAQPLVVDAYTSDSRAIPPSAIFVALLGDTFDGHDFIAAIHPQIRAAMVNESWWQSHHQRFPNLNFVVVGNTTEALLTWGKAHARAWRERSNDRALIALSGSNGKTSTKDMLAHILRAEIGEDRVLSTLGNLNNFVGLPQTLLRLNEQHRYAVVELGINTQGEMAKLSEALSADIVYITNAGRVHLAGLNNVRTVACEKGELYRALRSDGVAMINGDDPHHCIWQAMAKGYSQKIIHPQSVQAQQDSAHSQVLHAHYQGLPLTIQLPVIGAHQAGNALACMAIAESLSISAKAVKEGLAHFRLTPGRLQWQKHPHFNTLAIIDDSYNANPESMKQAIQTLAQQKGKKILAMGDMKELGEEAIPLHRQLQEYALAQNFEGIYVLGQTHCQAAAMPPALNIHYTLSHDHMATAIFAQYLAWRELADPTTILIKGSRSMNMEKVTSALFQFSE